MSSVAIYSIMIAQYSFHPLVGLTVSHHRVASNGGYVTAITDFPISDPLEPIPVRTTFRPCEDETGKGKHNEKKIILLSSKLNGCVDFRRHLQC